MGRPALFFDSSALFAGIVSPSGAARALLLLAEAGEIQIVISEQVLAETERAIARKAARGLPLFREAVLASQARVIRDPTPADVAAHVGLIGHAPDVAIVLAAMRAGADFLVTLNRRHFVDDPGVAQRAGLRIGSPGDALAWVRAIYWGGSDG
jgi:predicted nucleic acid-binding protein